MLCTKYLPSPWLSRTCLAAASTSPHIAPLFTVAMAATCASCTAIINLSDAFRRLPKIKSARDVAAIVREYSTQVQHHQLIFLQSLGGWTRMWQRATARRMPRCFRTPGPTLRPVHLVFDLRRDFDFAHPGLSATSPPLPPPVQPGWPPGALPPVPARPCASAVPQQLRRRIPPAGSSYGLP